MLGRLLLLHSAIFGMGAIVGLALLLAMKVELISSSPRGLVVRLVVVCLLSCFWFWLMRHILETRVRTRWLTSRVIAISETLKQISSVAEPDEQRGAVKPEATRWPWGTHHTEHLGHLEAAAAKFWANYEPGQPDTAPTNDMVAEWLVEHRSVSKDKARTIASILRPDGLRTGPRR